MRAEIVAIGSELLLGQITDTNSSWIGEQLALAGIDSYFQTKVGDNLGRIVETLRLALGRSDAVICCGGLGPTQDDLTREAIAEVMGVPLEPDEEMEERIVSMFAERGRRMPMNNLRQALRPRGASFIPEQPGTAPGLICPIEWPDADGEPTQKVIYAVPGVPSEMQEMISGTVLPDLQRRAGANALIGSRVLRTWGESESGVSELLADHIEDLDRVGGATLALLASGGEGIKVRITAKGEDEKAVAEVLDREEERVRKALGPLVFGVDDDTMESVVLDLLRSRGLTLAVAESLTGGLVGSRLVAVPGASDVFKGAVVAYASQVKYDLLDVPDGPVVTEDAARAMALGVRRRLGADVGIAATGVAGPDLQEGQSPGTVYLAVVVGEPDAGGSSVATMTRLPGRRNQVREFSAITLLGMLRRHLIDHHTAGEVD